jgi:hypothetical protein
MDPHVHPRRVVPDEERLLGRGRTLHEVQGCGSDWLRIKIGTSVKGVKQPQAQDVFV